MFSKNFNLQKHIRTHIHTSNKPYKCDVYLVKDLVIIVTYRHTYIWANLKPVTERNETKCCKHTLEHVLVINHINVIYIYDGEKIKRRRVQGGKKIPPPLFKLNGRFLTKRLLLHMGSGFQWYRMYERGYDI